MSDVQSISVTELFRRLEKGESLHVIDVRNPEESKVIRASCVNQLLPLGTFDPKDITKSKDDEIFFICRSGARSYDAGSRAVAYGFKRVYNVEGGTMDWEAAGLPVDRG